MDKNGRIIKSVIAIAAVVVLGAGPASAACKLKAIASSTFNKNLSGWTSNTPAEVVWHSSGGNPGGFVQFTDMTSATTYIDAPASFHGAYTALDGAGFITFQHNILQEQSVSSYDPYQVFLSGPGGAAVFNGGTPTAASTGWLTVAAPLAAADWTVTSGTWSGLLANVTDLQIVIEVVGNNNSGTDIEGIDNVAVVSQSCGFGIP
jgi:hypothetical protein